MIVVKKNVVAPAGFVVVSALLRRVVVVDFLFLLWRSWSERCPRTGKEKSIFLQIWEKQKQKGFVTYFMSFSVMQGNHRTVNIERKSQ